MTLRSEEALMLSISFQVSLWWPVHMINPVDKSKLFCNTPHLGSTTVSLEILFVCLLKHHWYAHSILSVIFFIIMRTCSKLPTPWRSNHSSPNIIDWQFSCLCHFSTNGISLRSGKAEMKNLLTEIKAGWLSWRLFTPSSRVCLQGEPACRLHCNERLHNHKLRAAKAKKINAEGL